ncbi:hypothetical protein EV421DRAFT_1745857 [Armillaria borealis]|uniref:HNH nuclease domain-containing protein n=1 Tax=Armillaria borealis TaxID=47425 RepID=A0AA39M5T0_9AGAR|nr:hypothetical protein EV421DRAFT_1745857 [Armillaria borealis]
MTMTLYSSKGGVETYYFHYTSNSDIPVEAICWNEGEEDQPIEIPSTINDTTNTTDDLVDQARELIKNFQGDTPIVKALNWYYYSTREEEWLYSDLRQQLLRQQDYHCPITGMVELGQPMLSSKWTGSLGIFHILQRPRIFDSRRNRQTDFFGPITREIIQNYIGSGMDLDSIPRDDPSNAVALELNTCSHLRDFRMSLKATGNPNEYAVERYGASLWPVLMNDIIVFKEGTPPDPRYIHLHACVADVLQRSGVGSVIDKILGCLPYPSRTRHPEDLQGVLTTLGLRYSLITALQLPQSDFEALV